MRARFGVMLLKFYLGTHIANWLGKEQLSDVPLFISRRQLFKRKTFPRATMGWALDSGGFTELNKYGEWTLTTTQYAQEVRRFRDEVGNLEWAAAQDWMCEPVVRKKTGKTTQEHQQLTVINFLELRNTHPDLPFVPVLQGWERDDYLRHIDDYARSGIDLANEPLVAIGSVCRRQASDEIASIVKELHNCGLSLHGFGVKLKGIEKAGHALKSSDSLAWSFTARYKDPLPGHEARHKNCANCLDFALLWREKIETVLKYD